MISHYLLEQGRIAIKRMRHGLMMYNRNDIIIGRSLDRYGEWCEGELRLFHNVLRPGDVVLDVGANIGTHALGFAAMVGRQGRVFAFEPQPLVFNLLCANMALNSADNVRCLNKAAGLGGAFINVPRSPPDLPNNFGDLSLRGPAAEAAAETDRVDLIPIDDLDLPACRLIKADVQGMEAEVLRSAARTIAAHRPFLYVECEHVHQAPEVIGLMEEYGYDLWWHAVAYHSDINFYDNQQNAFPNYVPALNLLAIPTELAMPVTGLDRCLGIEDDPAKFLARLRSRAAER